MAGGPINGAQAAGESRINIILAVSSGLFLGLAFPPSPFYSLAYIAFVPFMFLLQRMHTYGQCARYAYLFLLVFHIVTVYWTGGYTHANDVWLITSNVALVTLHPFFYFPSVLLAFFVWRKAGTVAGLFSLAFFWISYEYAHSLGEFSFPWMTVGNSQAYDLVRIQIAEYTSAYGVSFLLFAFNGVAYLLLENFASNRWTQRSWQSIVSVLLLLLLYIGPWLYGRRIMASPPRAGTELALGIVQPDFDPWEKWGEGFAMKWDSYLIQFNTLLDETRKLDTSDPDLVLWPETAIPFPILLPRYVGYRDELLRIVDSTGVPVFSGFTHLTVVDSAHASVTAQRIGQSGTFVETYNAALLVKPGGNLSPVYKKIVLVPFAERIPYASALKFLIEPLKWQVGISSWGKGTDTLVYHMRTKSGKDVQYSGMICYESVYPNFVREFVRKGAQFLVVLTNDSWWGNTSGAYQHAAYASFRAIENRRWVVQCANGGISEYVDPMGIVHVSTKMNSTARWISTIETNDTMTFYTRHGDVFAQACLFCSGVFLILGLYRMRVNGKSDVDRSSE
ncbi:MAG: apolipoprotein N-acyltransferase [Bacteroidota bacterium]